MVFMIKIIQLQWRPPRYLFFIVLALQTSFFCTAIGHLLGSIWMSSKAEVYCFSYVMDLIDQLIDRSTPGHDYGIHSIIKNLSTTAMQKL